MHTLLIDSSGPYSTAAVVRDSTLVGFSTLEAQPLVYLHDEIRQMVARLSLEMDGIGRIGVVSGPGSWTGLNIGVTAAKTLAQVIEVPVVELSSLDALVAGERWLGGRVHALLDAKRGNVYCSSCPTDSKGWVDVTAAEPRVVSFEDWCETMKSGEGTPLVVEYGDVFRERIEESLPEVCRIGRDFLTPAGLTAALLAREGEAVTGAEAMKLAPRYMQKLVSRDPGRAGEPPTC